MTQSYNPINCSPEIFYNLFLQNYKSHKEHSFLGSKENSFHEKIPLNLLYTGSLIKGVINEAGAVITIKPYSERRTFRKGKTQDIGSVVIASSIEREIRLTLKALEDITQVKLRKNDKPKK